MTAKSQEAYHTYLKLLFKTFSQTKTAAAMGLSRSTTRNWLMASKRDAKLGLEESSEYYFDFEGRTKWMHQHAAYSVKHSLEIAEETLRHWAAFGTEKIVRNSNGVPVWKRDTRLVGRPDLQALCGQDDDLYRDAQGNVVPETIVERPPFDGVLKLLSAHIPEYRDRRSVDVNHSVTGGVMVVGGPNPGQKKYPPKELEVIDTTATVVDTEPADLDAEIAAAPAGNPNVSRDPSYPGRAKLEQLARDRAANAERLQTMANAGGMKVV